MTFWRKKKCCCDERCFYQAELCPGQSPPFGLPLYWNCADVNAAGGVIYFQWPINQPPQDPKCFVVTNLGPEFDHSDIGDGNVVTYETSSPIESCNDPKCDEEPPPPCFVQTVPCDCPEPPPGPAPWVTCVQAFEHIGDVVDWNGYCWLIVTGPQVEVLPPNAVLIDLDDETIHPDCQTCCPPTSTNNCDDCSDCPDTVTVSISGIRNNMVQFCRDQDLGDMCCLPDINAVNIVLTKNPGQSCEYHLVGGLTIPGGGQGGCDLIVSQAFLICEPDGVAICQGAIGWRLLVTFDVETSCDGCELTCPTSPQVIAIGGNRDQCPVGISLVCCDQTNEDVGAAFCGCWTALTITVN